MLTLLFSDFDGVFRLLNSLTFRAGAALMTALLICLIIGQPLINWLKGHLNADQPIRHDGPETHFVKQGTPTMGGAMILIGIFGASLIWADLREPLLWIALMVIGCFGLIGFADDWRKVKRQDSQGLSGRARLAAETFVAFGAAILFVQYADADPIFLNTLYIPFFEYHTPSDPSWNPIKIGFSASAVLAILVMVGASNAVNITDGLDGLAIVPVMITAASFALIAYLVGSPNYARELALPEIDRARELALICATMVGAGLGFLWFNAPPAKVFMGDTGSLAIGAGLGIIAIMTRHEVVLGIIGGLFVLEALSVFIQVGSFKLTGQRVFKMAPVHHHFEKMGWAESTIVVRFWIVSVVLALVGLSSLKLQ